MSRRTEVLLAIACAASAIALGASELMNTFALRPPGGETQELLGAGERHHYALLVLGVFAVLALLVAVVTGSKPAALAVAAAGVLALLIFLLTDLPDAGQLGTLDDPRQSFVDSKAYPVSGFYMELVGSTVLALCGAALATLRPDQLKLFGPSLPRAPGPLDRHGELG
ncbi:MAG: hypothetical protein QOG09_1087 [Solirubrobacterales bacterium]|nr:hypothetical protein [Solirubrobacterales bacterium]